jgi:hypothetical protein
MLFEDILEKSTLDFNTLKCVIGANCVATISTIGGINFFDAYFPCKRLIYKVLTPSRYTKEWYQHLNDLLCPQRQKLVFSTDKDEFMEYVQQLTESS